MKKLANELKGKSKTELITELANCREELAKKTQSVRLGQEKKVDQLKKLKYKISVIKTLLASIQ